MELIGNHYTLEELLPLLSRLVGKYTSFESSSVTNECAQTLMEAILYCIQEYEDSLKGGSVVPGGEDSLKGDSVVPGGERSLKRDSVVSGGEHSLKGGSVVPEREDSTEEDATASREKNITAANTKIQKEKNTAETNRQIQKIEKTDTISAADAYQRGYGLVVQKTKAANELYNRIMENFCDYGNRALHDTMLNEMPEFFLHYDARFAPQEELLLLAYPVPEPPGQQQKGINRIYPYLCYIEKEQEFLRKFPEGYVQEVCKEYHEEYEELFINLAEIMMEKSPD